MAGSSRADFRHVYVFFGGFDFPVFSNASFDERGGIAE